MGALDGAKLTGRILVSQRLVVAFAAGIAAAATVLELLGSIPLVGGVLAIFAGLVYVFVEPYLASGFLGVVDAAIDGEASRGTFRAAADEHYADMLVGRLVLLVPLVAYEVLVYGAATFLAGVVHVSVGDADWAEARRLVSTPFDPGAVSVDPFMALGVVLLAVAAAAAASAFVALQFYPAAIVIADASPLESFRYSYELVREHPVGALGYTALTSLGGVALMLPATLTVGAQAVLRSGGYQAGASPMETMLAGSLVAMLGAMLVFFVVKTAVVALARTYHVAFVRTTLGTA
jgi:hypothetical protein